MDIDVAELLSIIGAKEYTIVQLQKQVQHLTNLLEAKEQSEASTEATGEE